MSNPELIVCAAIRFELIDHYIETRECILPMVRHYSPDAHKTLNLLSYEYEYKEIEQGFITNKGRFVDRKEALEIAKANNQIRHKTGGSDELYSEDLY